jgi:hypothetical protein
MIRKPTSGDSEQRNHESERARKSSTLSAGGLPQASPSRSAAGPMHGGSDGESAHGALPRHGIEDDRGD